MKADTYTTGAIVTRDDWNGGKPVRILDARPTDGGTAVRYQDVTARTRAHQVILTDRKTKRGGR